MAAGRGARGGAGRWGAGAIVQDINDNLNVGSLCRALPERLQELADKESDRIRK